MKVKMKFNQTGSRKYLYNGAWHMSVKAGQTIDTTDEYGAWLVEKGYASPVKSSKKKETATQKQYETPEDSGE